MTPAKRARARPPATVDFVVLSPDTYNVTEAQGTATFPISGTSKIDNRDGGTTFNGEVHAWQMDSSHPMGSKSRFP